MRSLQRWRAPSPLRFEFRQNVLSDRQAGSGASNPRSGYGLRRPKRVATWLLLGSTLVGCGVPAQPKAQNIKLDRISLAVREPERLVTSFVLAGGSRLYGRPDCIPLTLDLKKSAESVLAKLRQPLSAADSVDYKSAVSAYDLSIDSVDPDSSTVFVQVSKAKGFKGDYLAIGQVVLSLVSIKGITKVGLMEGSQPLSSVKVAGSNDTVGLKNGELSLPTSKDSFDPVESSLLRFYFFENKGPQSGLPVGKGSPDGSRSEAELGPVRSNQGPQSGLPVGKGSPDGSRSEAELGPVRSNQGPGQLRLRLGSKYVIGFEGTESLKIQANKYFAEMELGPSVETVQEKAMREPFSGLDAQVDQIDDRGPLKLSVSSAFDTLSPTEQAAALGQLLLTLQLIPSFLELPPVEFYVNSEPRTNSSPQRRTKVPNANGVLVDRETLSPLDYQTLTRDDNNATASLPKEIASLKECR
jgi:hypothetical protein